ncbi:hypothetical protein Ahy_B02g061074 [Arachis hypogaea]|uniref:Uncharacterized protein n=1 Tax=Arachis hypogaea TaxID=3818 RepID=A0A445AK21_ARAHY|nr:hypothetical protein Ahy_B02g061074 [Arachis hypogaea]
MISRALEAAREEVIGDEDAQYSKIMDYLMELHRTNPGSTARLDVIPQPVSSFGYYGGQLLSVVGQDGNNHFFVIAYAVVPNEWIKCPNWLSLVGFQSCDLTIKQVQQTGENNSTANAEKTTLDGAAKAKKNKKKLLKTSARGQSVDHSQGEKINVSQSAPQADEVKNGLKLNLQSLFNLIMTFAIIFSEDSLQQNSTPYLHHALENSSKL